MHEMATVWFGTRGSLNAILCKSTLFTVFYDAATAFNMIDCVNYLNRSGHKSEMILESGTHNKSNDPGVRKALNIHQILFHFIYLYRNDLL